MKKELLLTKFYQAINWNIFLYTIYKLCFILVSYLLYLKISPFYFSQWAMSNALVFLALLWIDPGFKKSIPRFYPIFSQDPIYHKRFIFSIVITQALLLITALVPYMYILTHFIQLQSIHFVLSILFLTEGLGAIFQTLYHAHFKNKQFNLLQILCTLCEMAANIYFITHTSNELHLIQTLFITKIASSCAIIAGSLFLIPNLYQQKLLPAAHLQDPNATIKQFIVHSFFMWASTIIKSLTERNFLFPCFTHIFGVISANTFKVAHDGALFFQRISLKALGSADTALLSYTQITNKSDLHKAFNQIVSIVSYLTFTFACIGAIVFITRHSITSHDMIVIFLIVAIGYMIEIFYSPYERLLEIKREYKKLWISYTPYIVITACLALVIYTNIITISLITILFIIHIARVISSLCMVWHTKKY